MNTGTEINHGEILVVDDTPANLKLLMDLLNTQGYKVRPAPDGKIAIAAVAARKPDLILLDIKMPDMDGYEVCRRLKENKQSQEIPIIFISALAALEDRIKGFAVGGVDFITKPFQREEVLARVSTHLQLFQMQQNLENLVDERTEELNKAYQSLQKSETEAREAEKKYRTLFESSIDAIMLLDDTGFIDCNDASLRIFGCTDPKKIIGSNPVQWSPPTQADGRDSSTAAQEENAIAYREGQNFFEWIFRRDNGEEFFAEVLLSPMEIGGNRVVQATVRDITERRQLEEDQIRLSTAIEQASETVVITDPAAKIQFVNPAFEHITGYSREEAIGQNPRILQSGKHDRAFYKEMWSVLLQGKPWHGHLINKKKDETYYEEEVTISPVTTSGGKIINYVAVKRDVTNEISLEKQLRQAMKLEAIGTLAGGIAHDFNNILSAILGYGELAQRQLPENHLVAKHLEQILKAGNRAADLTKQILTFSRQDEGELKVVAVQPLVREVLKLLRSSLPTTIDIKQDLSAPDVLILADPTQIHQVLMNLCTNAKFAMGDDGGTLSVSLDQLVVSSSSAISLHPDIRHGNYLDLEVRDTGCGMDDLVLENIFDPFFTTREQGQGTGLGLSVVYGIVKKHHGEITVSSEPDKGTSFHVYLPVITEEGEPEGLKNDVVPGGNERILIVDDDSDIAEIIAKLLIPLGYQATIFTSSIEALKQFKATPEAFDLIITDMTMPHMTGKKLATELMAIRPEFPVILCTGYSESVDKTEAKSLGIRELLMKPFVKNELEKAIRNALS